MTDRDRGRRLLRELLPWAKAEARKDDHDFKSGSPLGKTTAAYVTYDNLEALMIYPAPVGGWHADISLKRTPPGVPDSIGSPVASPYPTRQAAEEGGKRLLVIMCLMANKNAASAKPKPDPVFLLHGTAVPLSSEVYAIALALSPEGAGGPNGGYETKAKAIERIETILADLFPGGFTVDAANALPLENKAQLMTVLSIAALTGVYAYPPRTDASPSGHRPPETRH